jgi:hypothetical protein
MTEIAPSESVSSPPLGATEPETHAEALPLYFKNCPSVGNIVKFTSPRLSMDDSTEALSWLAAIEPAGIEATTPRSTQTLPSYCQVLPPAEYESPLDGEFGKSSGTIKPRTQSTHTRNHQTLQ